MFKEIRKQIEESYPTYKSEQGIDILLINQSNGTIEVHGKVSNVSYLESIKSNNNPNIILFSYSIVIDGEKYGEYSLYKGRASGEALHRLVEYNLERMKQFKEETIEVLKKR